MPRKPIKSRKIARPALLDFVRILLMDGTKACHDAMLAYNANNDPNKANITGAVEAFMMRLSRGGQYATNDICYPKMYAAWQLHRDEIFRIWKYEKRRGKPYGAKMFE